LSEVHASHEKIVFNNHRPNLSNVVLHSLPAEGDPSLRLGWYSTLRSSYQFAW
jgi:hypothetical protein